MALIKTPSTTKNDKSSLSRRKKALDARKEVRNKYYEDRRVKRIPMWPQWLGY